MPFTNKLIHETSPYLLQHAHNPVNWLPYGDEAFSTALSQNKPLLISIGYSSCHWCHVMEHETFENEELAALMNQHFVCVKVDREEHPDVDHVYMDAVQQIHGNGGWPLNCFALPDGRPFWGGTYFKSDQWKQLLENIIQLYSKQYQQLEAQADEISEGVKRQNYLIAEESVESIGAIDFGSVFNTLHRSFDRINGGLSGAPKFPMPVILNFLLHYGLLKADTEAINMAEITLDKMSRGGIFDQAGGGFARYSTDSEWKIPHFEKMLYDNAQLISSYALAFEVTQNSDFKAVAEQTIGFLNREMHSADGAFFSAIDADSDKGEGYFYTWSEQGFDEALGHYAALAKEYFGVGKEGLWEHGRSILLKPASDKLFAQQHFLSADELTALTTFCRNELLKNRNERQRPALDDKVLLAWNAMLISALCDAHVAFQNIEYLVQAEHLGTFLLAKLKCPEEGYFHTWKSGIASIEAYLDDYAFLANAYLKLYSGTAETLWLDEAVKICEYVVLHFSDSHTGLFWYSKLSAKHVFSRKIEIYDGVMPSGNSVMAEVLYKIGVFLHRQDFINISKQMLRAMEPRITRYPSAYSAWASLALLIDQTPIVVAIAGPEARNFSHQLKRLSLSGVMVYSSEVKSDLPYFENRYVKGKTLVYICPGMQCLLPVETVAEAKRMLRSITKIN